MKFLKKPKEVDAIQLKIELCHHDGRPIAMGTWLVQDEHGRQFLMEDERFRASYNPIFEMPTHGKGLFDRLAQKYEQDHPKEKRREPDLGQAIVDDAGTRHYLHKKPPSWDEWAKRFWHGHKGDQE